MPTLMQTTSPAHGFKRPRRRRGAAPANPALHDSRTSLDCLFNPRSVALIGATDAAGSVGRSLVENLHKNPFAGSVHLVNPGRSRVLGTRVFPSVAETPAPVDLAIIATPAETVPGVVAECADAGVKGAVIISAGFKEAGQHGVDLEREVLAAAAGRLRILGPNSMGIIVPHLGLNASLAPGMARRGGIGFVSQSGALCAAILDWSFEVKIGFSAFLSIGTMADIGWPEVLDSLGDDPETRSIVMYMETIGNARSFLSAAREVALTKPIIVLKVGRTEPAARAAESHTGSMTPPDEVIDAAFRRAGVLRVDTIAELFEMAAALEKQPRPKGPRLTIVSNAGGPGALAADMLVRGGGTAAALSPESMAKLDGFLPTGWNHANPIDILGDADPARFAETVETALNDTGSDGVLAIMAPQTGPDPSTIAQALLPFADTEDKPLLASWMGGPAVEEGTRILNEAGVPVFAYPDQAARAFCGMWRHEGALRALYETPLHVPELHDAAAQSRASQLIEEVRRQGRCILTESESKLVLAAYGIPVTETHVAATPEQAMAIAEAIGYPVAIKLHSVTITRKAAIGGVKLHIRGAAAVHRAFREIKQAVETGVGAEHFQGVTVQPMVTRSGIELIFGSSVDPDLGPVLLFGAGGGMVGMSNDRAIGLPPLNATLARRVMERTRIYRALLELSPALKMDVLEQLLVRFSYLVAGQRWIREIDVNPLVISSDGAIALDARMILHEAETAGEDLPELAIRPYPNEYVSEWKLRDSTPVTIRPIRPEDEPRIARFHETLSEESVHFRYFGAVGLSQRITHERLTRRCFIDYAREMALVAEHCPADSEETEIIGVGRLSRPHGMNEGEFAVLISDSRQRQGLGTHLLRLLVDIGRREGLERIVGHILPENAGMLRAAAKAGFSLQHDHESGERLAEIDL